ncbi:MAG TPA: DUF2807 domain-containing protein [Bacteroidia bacterium]|nr:DUF2807 domain-containing protein [Bacteroidia bacterium]
MKKTFMLSASLFLLLLITHSVIAETHSYSEVRSSDPYHNIAMVGDAELVLVPSDKFEISLEGSKDQIINMVTILKNDTLFIQQTNKKDRKNSRTRILVSVNGLKALHVKGNTDVTANGYINSDILTIKAEQGAVVNLDLKASKVKSKTLGFNVKRSSEQR